MSLKFYTTMYFKFIHSILCRSTMIDMATCRTFEVTVDKFDVVRSCNLAVGFSIESG